MQLLHFILTLSVIQTAFAATVTYDFNIGWKWLNPDGLAARPVIVINEQWPPPQIRAVVGDTVVVNVVNGLGNQSTSLHFHGLFMNGTTHMDGTSLVSQCAIASGSRFTYRFAVNQPGTYWYHSHQAAQYPDGLRGVLVVEDPEIPFKSQYSEELVVSLSDWYHHEMSAMIERYDLKAQKMPSDPKPDSNLINDTNNVTISVKPGQTYLVRLINIGAFVGQYFWIEGHTMTVIEVDGVYTKPAETDVIFIAAGQRYSFLLTTKADVAENFAIVSRVDSSSYAGMNQETPNIDASGWLVYADDRPLPAPQKVHQLDALDDMTLVPYDEMPLIDQVDYAVRIDIDMKRQDDGMSHWVFNGLAYKPPQLPSLFSALTEGANATDATVYGAKTQTFVLEHNQVIEVDMKNNHMRSHPVHLHGHNFQIVHRSGSNVEMPAQFPLRRDTIVVKDHGTLKFRFRADNPGVWLFHCHMEWHAHSGLMATFVEGPMELQQQLQISHLEPTFDPSSICDAAEGQFIVSSSSGVREVSRFSSSAIIAIIGATVGFIGLALVFMWQRWKTRRGSSSAYTLVPLNDADT